MYTVYTSVQKLNNPSEKVVIDYEFICMFLQAMKYKEGGKALEIASLGNWENKKVVNLEQQHQEGKHMYILISYLSLSHV